MTAISVSERLLEMAAFYTPLALTVTFILLQKLLWRDYNFIRIFSLFHKVAESFRRRKTPAPFNEWGGSFLLQL